MAVVVNRQTARMIRSAHTPDYDTDEWLIKPDLSGVEGVSQAYWKVVGDAVVEMTDAEKEVVDQASAPSPRAIHVDLFEFDDRFELAAEIPGIDSSDIQLTISQTRVEIQNVQPDPGLSTAGTVLAHERPPYDFYRAVDLPAPVHTDQVTADLQSGVLNVTIQKVDTTTQTVPIV